MNQQFSDYFHECFFHNDTDFECFINSLTKPIKRSIRINIKKISVENLKKRLEFQGFILTPTFNPTVFYIERGKDFTLLENRLGYTPEHLA